MIRTLAALMVLGAIAVQAGEPPSRTIGAPGGSGPMPAIVEARARAPAKKKPRRFRPGFESLFAVTHQGPRSGRKSGGQQAAR